MLVAGDDWTAPTNRDAMGLQPYSRTGTSRVIGGRKAPARARRAVDLANRYPRRVPHRSTIRMSHWFTHTPRGTSVIRSTARPMTTNPRIAQVDAFTIALRSLIEV